MPTKEVRWKRRVLDESLNVAFMLKIRLNLSADRITADCETGYRSKVREAERSVVVVSSGGEIVTGVLKK